MTRPSKERLEEIRTRIEAEVSIGWDGVKELLAEIDALRSELNHAVYLLDKTRLERDSAEKERDTLQAELDAEKMGTSMLTVENEALAKERDQLKAENEKLNVFYDTHAGDALEKYDREPSKTIPRLFDQIDQLKEALESACRDSDYLNNQRKGYRDLLDKVRHERDQLRERISKLRKALTIIAAPHLEPFCPELFDSILEELRNDTMAAREALAFDDEMALPHNGDKIDLSQKRDNDEMEKKK